MIYIGFYPKFNISGFSIGINTGVRFDVSSKLHYETSSASENINNEVKPRTYIRGTFDYSVFFKDNMAINVGLYIGYDWGFAWSDTYANADVVKNESFGNLDLGIQVGYRFGPKF